MNKILTLAMAAAMSLTLAVQAPTEAHAGSKERALVAGVIVGAAAAALLYSEAKRSKRSSRVSRLSDGQDGNINCGRGRVWAPGRAKCISQKGPRKKTAKGKMLKRNGGGYISLASCKRKGMVPEFGYCVEND